jgi:membrane-associated phospholipid phosphatase
MTALLQAIHTLDVSVYRILNGFAGNWLADHLANFEEGNNLAKGGLFFGAYVYLWFRGGLTQEARRKAILAILIGTLLALVLCRTIADFTPFRVRPMYDPNLPHRAYSIPTHPNLVDWSSFPSDTAAYFFALAFGLAYLVRRHSALILLYTAGWICLPRLYLGEHYLSDVVVGAAIGVTIVVASLKSGWLQQNIAAPILRFMEAKPHVFYGAAFLVFFEMGVVFMDVRSAAQQLMQALRAGHVHELFRALLVGILVAVVIFLVSTILRKMHAVFSNRFRPVRIIWRRN